MAVVYTHKQMHGIFLWREQFVQVISSKKVGIQADVVLLGATTNEMGLFEWTDGTLVHDQYVLSSK